MSKPIELGCRVRDVSTGYSGIVMAIAYYLSGRIEVLVQPQCEDVSQPPPSIYLDHRYLERVGDDVIELPQNQSHLKVEKPLDFVPRD